MADAAPRMGKLSTHPVIRGIATPYEDVPKPPFAYPTLIPATILKIHA
jgi:hypothetical protein